MSSVVNYVSSCSRAFSLRAAQLPNSCTSPKAPTYNGYRCTLPPTNPTLACPIPRCGLSVRYIHTHRKLGSKPDAFDQSSQSVPQEPGTPLPWLNPRFWRELRLQSSLNRAFVDRRADDERANTDSSRSTVANAAKNGETTHGTQRSQRGASGIRKDDSCEDYGYDAPGQTGTESTLRSTPLSSANRDGLDIDRPDTVQDSTTNTRANPHRQAKRLKRSNPWGYAPDLTSTEYLILSIHKAHDPENRHWACEEIDDLQLEYSQAAMVHYKGFHRITLQEIVADYIRKVSPLLDRFGVQCKELLDPGPQHFLQYSKKLKGLHEELERVFCEANIEKLASRGYAAADVVKWAWVLKSETPYEACLRILLADTDQYSAQSSPSGRVPPFIALLILRQGLDVRTFRLLLHYSLDLLTGQYVRLPNNLSQDTTTKRISNEKIVFGKTKPLINFEMCSTFVIRLLHHARQLWPEAQLAIIQAFAFYLNTLEKSRPKYKRSEDKLHALLVDRCNTVLRLLSLPSRREPFLSVSFQQRAQLELLRAMAAFQPALPVTKRGYQSLVAVQLAHRKTEAERQSAELKAPSWPPWKENKLGYDVDRGLQGRKSRAMRVLVQKLEAGYSSSAWDNMSRILAGWDTDGSPTIQTRSFGLSRPEILGRFPAHSDHYKLWEARIRATRTVREAWACFLSYQEKGLRPHGAIYAAMAEKLIQRDRTSSSDDNSMALPGDGLEVFPEPLSARDLIYVPSEPPTLNNLLHMMLSQSIRPSGRFLALLLRHAPTFHAGLEYLCCSNLTDEQLGALCIDWGSDFRHPNWLKTGLNELSDFLVASFVKFLCSFGSRTYLPLLQPTLPPSDLFPLRLEGKRMLEPLVYQMRKERPVPSGGHRRALPHVIDLLRARASQPPQAWIHVLSAVIERSPHGSSAPAKPVAAWFKAQLLMRWMDHRQIDTGLEGFNILCQAFSRVLMIRKYHAVMEEGLDFVSKMALSGQLGLHGLVLPRPEDVVSNGLNFLKQQFDKCVLGDPQLSSLLEHSSSSIQLATDSQVTLPPMFHVPSPAVLHLFVRTLGIAEDSDGLLSLLRWMKQHELTLKEKYDQLLNGDRMMRRVIVAFRVFLEGSRKGRRTSVQQEDGDHIDSTRLELSDSHLQEAYEIITSSQVWGSWPTDEEFKKYIAQ
ncbi:hypothetical protein ASPACDRAFT_1852092 [Aspergillus aculeatus ATCC 16872]|uniref:Uncharacterized protein n=1 Tax=Aspergillus aculeatus (strain ATCC 16872 / CBS 172.66 / WB 5094) TaxID=690307 RepID=A0A1L9X9N1_ASPA1|nr:uncharacterized protein ASPACDRAFT_1852092 [Aspergillus aculeatus ATCC 16872]OJK05145.1 hypothetical protein ASPACDRAFT_1852092 [Aspergillus aculeatus ATCC 16872]